MSQRQIWWGDAVSGRGTGKLKGVGGKAARSISGPTRGLISLGYKVDKKKEKLLKTHSGPLGASPGDCT